MLTAPGRLKVASSTMTIGRHGVPYNNEEEVKRMLQSSLGDPNIFKLTLKVLENQDSRLQRRTTPFTSDEERGAFNPFDRVVGERRQL